MLYYNYAMYHIVNLIASPSFTEKVPAFTVAGKKTLTGMHFTV